MILWYQYIETVDVFNLKFNLWLLEWPYSQWADPEDFIWGVGGPNNGFHIGPFGPPSGGGP